MDKAALVSVDISRGSEILEILDRANLDVSAILWAFLSEYDAWRLVLAARQFDLPDPRDAYRLLHELLTPGGFTVRNTPPVLILRTSDPFIRDLVRLYGKTTSADGLRLGGQLIGDRSVDDGFVYRISPSSRLAA